MIVGFNLAGDGARDIALGRGTGMLEVQVHLFYDGTVVGILINDEGLDLANCFIVLLQNSVDDFFPGEVVLAKLGNELVTFDA